MRLRSLNEAGMAQASSTLDRLRSGELKDVPQSFLESDEFTTDLELDLKLPKKHEIQTRWQLGLWLYKHLEGVIEERELFLSSGLWTWLAFFLFDTICPALAGGRKIAEDAKYILIRGDYRKSYRHLVSGPYFMIKAHSDMPGVVRGLLATAPSSPGDVYEQLASRKQVVTSRAAMATATRLYWDPVTESLRRGAAGAGPGSARRFARVLMQYDVTFDLYALEGDRLIAMLPKEFSRFRKLSSEVLGDL